MPGRYLLTLLLTLIIEGFVACLLGLRKAKVLLALAMINVITHLLLNYLLVVLGFLGLDTPFVLIVALEMLIVIAEWQLLVVTFGNVQEPFLLTSLLGNTASFLVGLLLFWT